MNLVEYWKKRCELAEAYIDESPCDPDIYREQLDVWNNWREFKKLPIPVVSERFSFSIAEMENEILANLSDLDSGYGRRKWVISKQTGIPEDILTVLLKRLKLAGKVELIMIWSESTGLPDGSGYCLQGGLNAR